MPKLQPKTKFSAAYVAQSAHMKFTTSPAYKVYVPGNDDRPVTYEYTTDPDRPNIIEAAVLVTWEDESFIYLDTDEVIF